MSNRQASPQQLVSNCHQGYRGSPGMSGLRYPTMIPRFILIAAAAVFLLCVYGCTRQCEVNVLVEPREAGEVFGTGTYRPGEKVTISARPDEGYQFAEWTEGDRTVSTEAEYTFEVEEDRELTAVFTEKQYSVTVEVGDETGGTVFGDGTYKHGGTAVVRAEAEEGYQFIEWKEDGRVVSTDKTYQFTVENNVSLVGRFEEDEEESEDSIPEKALPLPEKLEGLTAEEMAQKVEAAVLDLGIIGEMDERGPAIAAFSHLVIDAKPIACGRIITVDELQQQFVELGDVLAEGAHLHWHLDREFLVTVDDLYGALQRDAERVIDEDVLRVMGENFLQDLESQFKGIGYVRVSPGGSMIAFDLDGYQVWTNFVGAAGFICREEGEVFFTNINWGDLSADKFWSPDEDYLAYVATHPGYGIKWLYIDDVHSRQNAFTVGVEELNEVLEDEGSELFDHEKPGLGFRRIEWDEEGEKLFFATDDPSGKDERLDWELDLDVVSLQIE